MGKKKRNEHSIDSAEEVLFEPEEGQTRPKVPEPLESSGIRRPNLGRNLEWTTRIIPFIVSILTKAKGLKSPKTGWITAIAFAVMVTGANHFDDIKEKVVSFFPEFDDEKVVCKSGTFDDKDMIAIYEWAYKAFPKMSKTQCVDMVDAAFEGDDPLVVLSISRYEGPDPGFISSAGAVGLTGIMPRIHKDTLIKYGVIESDTRELFEVKTNIRAGQLIFSLKNTRAKGNIREALKLYRGNGDGRAGPYVDRVLRNFWYLRSLTRDKVYEDDLEGEVNNE